MHQAWTTGTATLDGEHYQVDGAIVQPQPLQAGGIPIWVAGGGEKVTLKIAAKYAQYTNFTGSLEEFAHKSDVLRGHCEALGTDFDAITRSSNFNTVIGTDAADVARRLDAIEARVAPYLGPEKTAHFIADFHSPNAAVGTPRAGGGEARRAARARPRLRHLVLPRGGVRPVGARAVGVGGRSRAAVAARGAGGFAGARAALRGDGLVELAGELGVGRLGEVGAVGEDDDGDLGAAADRLRALGAVELTTSRST